MTDHPRGVSRREFDDVIRRATELAAAESDEGDGRLVESGDELLAESELIRIAGEVGLPERHVRRALAEVRSGTLPRAREPGGPLDRVFGAERVRTSRVVPGTPRTLAAQIERLLVAREGAHLMVAGGSLRDRVRKQRLEAVDAERTLVELEVDPGTRDEAVGFSVTGAAIGAACGFIGMAGMYDFLGAFSYALGPVVAGWITAGSTLWARRFHRRRLGDAREEAERILGLLEAGHYHDAERDTLVAKDTLVTKDE